eukprot:3935879-Rhodomonas_salina.2
MLRPFRAATVACCNRCMLQSVLLNPRLANPKPSKPPNAEAHLCAQVVAHWRAAAGPAGLVPREH